jgi:hypothetical protein
VWAADVVEVTTLTAAQDGCRLHIRVAYDLIGIAAGFDVFSTGTVAAFIPLLSHPLSLESFEVRGFPEGIVRICMASLANLCTHVLCGIAARSRRLVLRRAERAWERQYNNDGSRNK